MPTNDPIACALATLRRKRIEYHDLLRGPHTPEQRRDARDQLAFALEHFQALAGKRKDRR